MRRPLLLLLLILLIFLLLLLTIISGALPQPQPPDYLTLNFKHTNENTHTQTDAA